jgi:hypothetical protein
MAIASRLQGWNPPSSISALTFKETAGQLCSGPGKGPG